MSLTIANTAGSGSGSRILYTNPTTDPQHRRHGITFPTSTCSSRITRAPFRTLHVVSAAKKLSSRTGRFDSKNRRGNTGAITTTEEDKKDQQQRTAEIGQDSTNINNNKFENAGVIVGVDGSPMPELPGLEPDFWEGPQWGAFGFFLQYLWAFGIVFALPVGSRWPHIMKEQQILKRHLRTKSQSNLETFWKDPTHLIQMSLSRIQLR
ncbi:hypothetical protein CISIN_1g028069mg [Citrus sinensis]|uniref:Uncharacterized protein n=1 Tax=Citrus sinensis TaxID=2711 RepID=A0A067DGH0_CITSI|nr:hypothetical protein CISIN_1g028069mg [Citrus sinensis]